MADLILLNGRLHTQDPIYPDATAAAVRDGRILAVGKEIDIKPYKTSKTRVIDLGGRLVIPGLTDSHFHFYHWALSLDQLKLAGAASLEEILNRVEQAARQTPEESWILGQGWNETNWEEQRLPDRTDLDRVSQGHPVILWRSDLHLAVVNSYALKIAEISKETTDPSDGVIDRDLSGEPTGILRELAINLVRRVIPDINDEDALVAMRNATGELHRLGITTVHDFRIMGGEDGPPAFRAYQSLLNNNELNLRIWMNIPLEKLDEAVAIGLKTGFGCDRLRIGHVKIFSDGSQGARTAWMLQNYEDVPHAGMPLTPMGQIAEAIYKADRSGLAVAVHAIGDRANRELINVFEEVLMRGNSKSPPLANHRIEHVQNIQPDELQRMSRLGISASVQPIHITDDIPMLEQSTGERARNAYVFRDILSAGITLALGSDCPVADPNPFWGIHAAVTRQRRDGRPQGGWYAQQRLTVEEAVWGYTMGPALVTGLSSRQGSITPGKSADLVILDRNLFSINKREIAEAKPLMTIFSGEVVFEGGIG
jgi:predicted amidohydrolase YtcJ